MSCSVSCSFLLLHTLISFFFFFNDTATTEIYTLSLHDALPILDRVERGRGVRLDGDEVVRPEGLEVQRRQETDDRDRKSTRLNSSHGYISYAVFCLKKKKKKHDRSMFNRLQ